MINPADKHGNLLFEPDHSAYVPHNGHKVDGLPCFDELAAGGVPSSKTSSSWTTRTKSEQALYDEQLRQAKAFVEARKNDPSYEPESVGDPSREWMRRLAKSDPDQCRTILETINALSEAERKAALQQAYVKYFYCERKN